MELRGKGQTCGGSHFAVPVDVFRGLRRERSLSRPVSRFKNYLEGLLESIFGWLEIFSYLQWQKASPAVCKHPPSCQKNNGWFLELGGKLTHGRLGAGGLGTEEVHQTSLWLLHHLGLERNGGRRGSRGRVLHFPEVYCCLFWSPGNAQI